jgi:hypothetical protein
MDDGSPGHLNERRHQPWNENSAGFAGAWFGWTTSASERSWAVLNASGISPVEVTKGASPLISGTHTADIEVSGRVCKYPR